MFDTEEKPIIKTFTINGKSSWVKAKGRTLCALYIWPESMQIQAKVLKGFTPFSTDFMLFILGDKDVQLLVRKYQQKGRVRPYSMRVQTGMSGCSSVYINYTDEYGLEIEGRKLLEISCYNKMWGFDKMYIGDFAEAVYVYKFDPPYGRRVSMSNPIFQMISVRKYIKSSERLGRSFATP